LERANVPLLVEAHELAGEMGVAVYDYPGGAIHYEQALETLRRFEITDREAAWRIWAGLAMARESGAVTGGGAELSIEGALRAYTRQLDLSDDDETRAEVLGDIARLEAVLDRDQAALEHYAQAITLLDGIRAREPPAASVPPDLLDEEMRRIMDQWARANVTSDYVDLLLACNRPVDAERVARHWVEAGRVRSGIDAHALECTATTLEAQGDEWNAFPLLQEALQVAVTQLPEFSHEDLRLRLGTLALQLGKRTIARRALQPLAEGHFEHPPAPDSRKQAAQLLRQARVIERGELE
jgi:tetratricopeptide (TPR) repeat protein